MVESDHAHPVLDTVACVAARDDAHFVAAPRKCGSNGGGVCSDPAQVVGRRILR